MKESEKAAFSTECPSDLLSRFIGGRSDNLISSACSQLSLKKLDALIFKPNYLIERVEILPRSQPLTQHLLRTAMQRGITEGHFANTCGVGECPA
jgi:hypothetical protein